MPSQTIQWFPGHMAKTRRMIKEMLPEVDIVLELLDARIPYSSKNPEIYKLIGSKPVLTILTKASLADPDVSEKWRTYYKRTDRTCIFADCVTGAGISDISKTVFEILSEKLQRYENKGMSGRTVKALVCGIPNVGKSSFINKLAGAKKAKVEDRPGVTVDKQWVTTSSGIVLLDTPGVLWPKFDERVVGENLAMTGAIRDQIIDAETVAIALVGRLRKYYPQLLSERYKLGEMEQYSELQDYELFELIGRKRGFLVSGGEVSYERTTVMLLDEFRGGKIGRISLEVPKEK